MNGPRPMEKVHWQLQDLPLDVLVKILCFLDAESLKQLRLASTTLCTAALYCIKRLRIYRRTGSEFGPWDPVESLPCLKGIMLRIGTPTCQDWDAYKKPAQRTTLTLGARRCIPLLAELVIHNIDWQCVDDASLRRLQHSMQLAPNLTKLEVANCNYLPSTLLAHCTTSICDLKIIQNTMLGHLEGPLMALSNLQRLEIRGTDVFGGPSQIRLWPRLLQLVPAYLPKLTDLSEVLLLGEGALSTLTSLHQLTRLRVEVWGEDGMVPVGPIFRMRGLAHLKLRVEGPDQFLDFQEGAPTLADLQQATQLRVLSLFVFETWEDLPPSALAWHPLCSALRHLTALTQLHVSFSAISAPTSALRLLTLPALANLELWVQQDVPEDRIWPILHRAAPLLQYLNIEFWQESQFASLLSCFQGLPSLTRLRISNYTEPAPEDWPSAACLTCHSGLRYLEAHQVFHAANIDRDLPLLRAFAQRHGLAIQFEGSPWVREMGSSELQHEWRERVRLSSAIPRYRVELEPLPDPNCPSSSVYKFRSWPYIW